MVTSKEKHKCPVCKKGELVGKETRKRHTKGENGEKVWYLIPRTKCNECGKTHNMLPDFMLPYKHYLAEIIGSVIDEKDIYYAIEESTIYRWKKWFISISS